MLAILQDNIEHRRPHSVLQPIIALGNGENIGYEGLILGPIDSPLHSPARLSGVTERHELETIIEHMSRQGVAETFSQPNLLGKLFINVSPNLLTHSSTDNGDVVTYLRALGLPPERVIIELTENQQTRDFARMREAG